jgi:hypothetical protein
VRSAFDGVLQSANVHLDNNRPSSQNLDPILWRATDKPSGSNSFYHLFYGPRVGLTVPGIIDQASISDPKWDSNSDINVAVFEGLDIGATFQVSRMMTVETFPSAGSDLIAFAKPSPLWHPEAIVNAMNAVRNEPRFWAAADNDFGAFARALKKGVSKVGRAAATVAAVHPATANQMQLANAVRGSSSRSTPAENAARIQHVEQLMRNLAAPGSGNAYQQERGRGPGFAQPKAGRKRTKPTGLPKKQKFN